MKIRNGFVSNSSSSSFVLLVNKDSAISILDLLETKKKYSDIKEKVLELGTEFNNILVFYGMSTDGFDWLDFVEINYDEWNEFTEQVHKLQKDEFFYESQSF